LHVKKPISHNASRHMQNLIATILTAVTAFCALFACLTSESAPLQSEVAIQLDTNNAGAAIPANFSGLGFEVSLLQPENGVYYFRPNNERLINLFHTLGI